MNRYSVLVCGEALVDAFPDRSVPGGAPFNVARHLAAFGARPLLATRLGDDADGRLLRAEMARFGLDDRAVQTDPCLSTGRVEIRETAPGRHTFHIAPDSAYDGFSATAFFRQVGQERLPGWIYTGTLAQRRPSARTAARQLATAWPARRYVDLNWREGHLAPAEALEIARGATVLKLNDEELAMLLGWLGLATPLAGRTGHPGERCAVLAGWLGGFGVGRLIVTHGAAGYASYDIDGVCEAAGGGVQQTALIDTVGAGDAFSAVALLGLISGWPLALALERANLFAAAVCGLRGPAPADLAFYDRWRAAWGLAAPATQDLPTV